MPALLGYLAWVVYLWTHLGFWRGLVFFAVAQMGGGLFLALVFGLGHNGMATYDADDRPDFWKLQVSDAEVKNVRRQFGSSQVGF